MKEKAEAIAGIKKDAIGNGNQIRLDFQSSKQPIIPQKQSTSSKASSSSNSTSNSSSTSDPNKKRKLDQQNQTSVQKPNKIPKVSSLPNVPLFSHKSARALSSLTSKQSLKSKDNPITHSKLGQMTQHYVSASTGHQQSNKVGVSAEDIYLKARYSKLQAQSAKKTSDLFRGVNAHITGYTGGHRNTTLTRLLQENGAKVLPVSSSMVTHTISSSPLSAKKTHEALMKKKIGARKYLVRPEWVVQSVEGRRKLDEKNFEPSFGAAGFKDTSGTVKDAKEKEEVGNLEESAVKNIKGRKTQRSLLDMIPKKT